ncbi:MAG: prolyl oligopeptidase family serine peptidase [Acidobacteria bacterium]|nr:prolyl oligopeptidase family serine peptidase [Acidobacteriota bacterium]MBI3470032.1 prolyl oligopeptidase family serine peptidase [Candidatus Solibacter usitatus]
MRLFQVCLLLATANAAEVRPVPPPGVPVPDKDRAELEAGLGQLGRAIEKLSGVELLPDVQIFHEAVRYALQYNEFFRPEEIARAKELLRQGQERAAALARGSAPWTTGTGLVVRGYVSKIDRSVQPYGLVVPATYSPSLPRRWRLDAWFHGRAETLSEVNFLYDRQRQPGEFTPPHTLVLHLYGRYCNANKLAGEVDLFEALADVQRRYPIDPDRIVVRGFSMGGAAAWHIAAHYPGRWAAAAPGAGFAETAEFLKVFQRETVQPTWWEQKLWQLYDATGYAANFYNLPLVAYSGEDDQQKQAADIMDKALAEEGMRMTHVIGPKTGHRYHPDSKVEIDRRIDAIAARGRDPYPRSVRFTTFTLRYNRVKWARVDALGRHWERARLDADLTATGADVRSANVTAFTLDFGPGGCPLDVARKPAVSIDGQTLAAPPPATDRSWTVRFRKTGGKWIVADGPGAPGLHKRHGLQGPIDDAFLDSFVLVRPTGTPLAPGVAGWVASEQAHAIREWRREFRGDAQVRDDTQITDADIASSNLVLWGDPGSNRILARIADRLPVRWVKDSVTVGRQSFPAATHAPILIYPNPLNPVKYVVLNSGFTFREYDYLNNARQIPKLPDFAMVDTTTPPDARYPGKIVAAGFFGEDWELP